MSYEIEIQPDDIISAQAKLIGDLQTKILILEIACGRQRDRLDRVLARVESHDPELHKVISAD